MFEDKARQIITQQCDITSPALPAATQAVCAEAHGAKLDLERRVYALRVVSGLDLTIVLSNVDTICAELHDVGMAIPLEWFYINIADNLPKRSSVVRDRLQGNQKVLTLEIMMTELCNHHAFLD